MRTRDPGPYAPHLAYRLFVGHVWEVRDVAAAPCQQGHEELLCGASAGGDRLLTSPSSREHLHAVRSHLDTRSPSFRFWQWDKGRIVELGWSRDLELLAVVEDGAVFTFDVQGSFLRSFSLGKVSVDHCP